MFKKIFFVWGLATMIFLPLSAAFYRFASVSNLCEAVGKGDKQRIQRMIAAGADIDGFDAKGYTPLLKAVETPGDSSLDIMQYLLLNGADPNKRCFVKAFFGDRFFWRSPLISALQCGHREKIQSLLLAEADVHEVGDVTTPLDYACRAYCERFHRILRLQRDDREEVDNAEEIASQQRALAGTIADLKTLLRAGARISDLSDGIDHYSLYGEETCDALKKEIALEYKKRGWH